MSVRLLKEVLIIDKKIDLEISIFYKSYGDGPIGTIWTTVSISDDDIQRIIEAGGLSKTVQDIYDRLFDEVSEIVDEEITTNDGYWYYDFTEAFSEETPFSIYDTENTGYSIKLHIDVNELNN